MLLVLAARYAAAQALDIEAVHVDHGLQAASATWAAHCARSAAALGVGCRVVTLAAAPPSGASIEAWAREQRYAALADALDASGCVLTAHHADDQMETVLQRVLGGAGPQGLGAIRPLRRLGAGWLARPLLTLRRAEIRAFANAAGLVWIEDPSNTDRRFERNQLRHDVMPVLEAASPALAVNLARVAALQRELAGLLDSLSDRALAEAGQPPERLALATLHAADARLRPYLLKRWLERAGVAVPGRRLLEALQREVVGARPDATPCLRLGAHEVRRYRENLYLLSLAAHVVPGRQLPCTIDTEIALPRGRLVLASQAAHGLAAARLRGASLSIRFREGGERCQPAGRAHARELKKLFQDWGVPPWERAEVPLLYVDEVLAAVGDYCVCAEFVAGTDEPACALRWLRG